MEIKTGGKVAIIVVALGGLGYLANHYKDKLNSFKNETVTEQVSQTVDTSTSIKQDTIVKMVDVDSSKFRKSLDNKSLESEVKKVKAKAKKKVKSTKESDKPEKSNNVIPNF